MSASLSPTIQDRIQARKVSVIQEIYRSTKDYEAKDILAGVPFCVSQGIRDVITFDPATNRVVHIRNGARTEHDSPIEINLLCGCVCTV